MNEEERAELLRIAVLVEQFGDEPTYQGYLDLLGRLRGLLRLMAGRGYDGIEYTVVKVFVLVLEQDVGGLGGGDAAVLTGEAVSAAGELCLDLHQWMVRLARQPAEPTAKSDVESEAKGSPASAVLMQGCVIDGGQMCFTDMPDVRLRVMPLVPALLALRDARVTYLGFSRTADMSREELTWLCNVARKVWSSYSEQWELCANIEIAAGTRRLHASLVFTKRRGVARGKETFTDRCLWVGYERRDVRPPVKADASKASVIAELLRDYQLKAIQEAGGASWKVVELLDVQAAFAKLPLSDRGALKGCLLVRDKEAPYVTGHQSKVAACYTPDVHRLAVFDRTFTGPAGFVGEGRDTAGYCHFPVLHEVAHALEQFYGPEPKRQADSASGWQDTGCAGRFFAKVTKMGLKPFTHYAWEEWPDNPFEMWADAYSLFLNNPASVEFISPTLFTWFRQGKYRVDSGTGVAVLVPEPDIGLTRAQAETVVQIRAELDLLEEALGRAAEAAVAAPVPAGPVNRLRKRHQALYAMLDGLCTQLSGTQTAKIERTILMAVASALDAGVGVPLGPLGTQLPAPHTAAFSAMRSVCQEERFALVALARPAATPPDGTTRRMEHRSCTVVAPSHPDGRKTLLVGAEKRSPFEVVGFSHALVLLRDLGFRSMRLRNGDGLSAAETTLLCNVARKVFVDCGSQFGVVVDTVVSGVGSEKQTYAVQISCLQSKGLRIRLEGQGIATVRSGVSAIAPRTLDQLTAKLATDFGITAVTGVWGGAWTAGELSQVCDALDKVPTPDRRILKGCKLVRKGNDYVPPTEPDKRRDGMRYMAHGHNLIITDEVFAGAEGGTCPSSHAYILRLVGHAVACQNAVPELSASAGLRLFVQVVTHLKVEPFTDFGAELWPRVPDDFFAEAYALFLNEPQSLAWISTALQEWFASGGYRGTLG